MQEELGAKRKGRRSGARNAEKDKRVRPSSKASREAAASSPPSEGSKPPFGTGRSGKEGEHGQRKDE